MINPENKIDETSYLKVETDINTNLILAQNNMRTSKQKRLTDLARGFAALVSRAQLNRMYYSILSVIHIASLYHQLTIG